MSDEQTGARDRGKLQNSSERRGNDVNGGGRGRGGGNNRKKEQRQGTLTENFGFGLSNSRHESNYDDEKEIAPNVFLDRGNIGGGGGGGGGGGDQRQLARRINELFARQVEEKCSTAELAEDLIILQQLRREHGNLCIKSLQDDLISIRKAQQEERLHERRMELLEAQLAQIKLVGVNGNNSIGSKKDNYTGVQLSEEQLDFLRRDERSDDEQAKSPATISTAKNAQDRHSAEQKLETLRSYGAVGDGREWRHRPELLVTHGRVDTTIPEPLLGNHGNFELDREHGKTLFL